MPELIIVRGYPGVGKTTFSKALAKQNHFTFIDHNDILNGITKYTANDNYIYKDIHSLELAMTKKLLHDGKSVIIARGFSKKSDFVPYIEYVKNSKTKYKVVRLEISIEVLIERVKSPYRDEDFKPIKSTPGLRKWIASNPIEDYEDEVILDATQPIADMITKLN